MNFHNQTQVLWWFLLLCQVDKVMNGSISDRSAYRYAYFCSNTGGTCANVNLCKILLTRSVKRDERNTIRQKKQGCLIVLNCCGIVCKILQKNIRLRMMKNNQSKLAITLDVPRTYLTFRIENIAFRRQNRLYKTTRDDWNIKKPRGTWQSGF